MLTGALLFFVFRGFTNSAAVRAWKRKRSAHMLSLYLFGDDPALSLRSLGQIAKANAALLLYAFPALLIAAPFVAAIVIGLGEFFTPTPLASGTAAVITVRLKKPCEPSVQAPAWVQVGMPPVHVPAANEISWRVRALAPRDGLIEIACAGERVTKEIDARPGLRYFAKARERRLFESLLHPGESRLPDGPIDRIALSESLAGPWAFWFGCIASPDPRTWLPTLAGTGQWERTPRSARVPPDPLFTQPNQPDVIRKRPTRGRPADQGVRPTVRLN